LHQRGPCADAIETREAVVVADLSDDGSTRWPPFAEAAARVELPQ
jgi:hypothetical protein